MSKYSQKHDDLNFSSANNSLSKIISLLPSHPQKILDIGCASGYLGKYIKSKYDCYYCGLDLDQKDISIASKYIDKAISINLETEILKSVLPTSKFDVIIMADILEHLSHPENLLEQIRSLITPNATIIISVPNVIHQSVLINLLQRKWEYESTGIMDNTHLRFFSLTSISKLITSSGFKITKVLRTTKPEKLPFILKPLRLFLLHPDFNTYQYIIQAKNDL